MAQFCTGCGQPTVPGSRFCGSCGQPVAPAAAPPAPPAYQPPPYQPPPAYQPPAQYPPPPAYPPPYQAPPPQYAQPQQPYYPPQAPAATPPAYGENRIGIMPGISRKKGFMGMEVYNAIVTDQRIIFATQTNQMVRDEAKKDRGGFFANMAGAVTAGYNIWKRYETMTPEQALRENPQNFAIAMNQIRRVKFDAGRILYKKGVVTVGLNVNRDEDEPAHLEIETSAEKFKFDITTHFQEEAHTALKQAGLIK
jgi:hypothetical protein